MTQRPNVSLQLVTVDQADVDQMLDCYDSGMFDISTSNAVALALKRLLRSEHRVRVTRESMSRECFVQIGDFQSRLPAELFDWLERAECASAVNPISFWVPMPNNLRLRRAKMQAKSMLMPNRSDKVKQVPVVA